MSLPDPPFDATPYDIEIEEDDVELDDEAEGVDLSGHNPVLDGRLDDDSDDVA